MPAKPGPPSVILDSSARGGVPRERMTAKYGSRRADRPAGAESRRSTAMGFVMTKEETESSPFSTDDDRWTAVTRRDRSADGVFYYSVLTTGVYCRPSCAARLARRENVGFHRTCEAAERAGFRPCKRCR